MSPYSVRLTGYGANMAQAARPPYTSVSDVDAFFQRVETLAEPKPSKTVDSDWVKSYGFETAHPSAIPSMLRWLGVIDEDGKSTGVWNDLRVDGKREATLQRLVKQAYEGVFEAIDVEHATARDLRGAFVQVHSIGDPARQIKCFLALCQQAGIPTAVEANSRSQPNDKAAKTQKPRAKATPAKPDRTIPAPSKPPRDKTKSQSSSTRVGISMNLNVEIPAEWTESDIKDRVSAVASAIRAADTSDS
jgi:hypothetical protein